MTTSGHDTALQPFEGLRTKSTGLTAQGFGPPELKDGDSRRPGSGSLEPRLIENPSHAQHRHRVLQDIRSSSLIMVQDGLSVTGRAEELHVGPVEEAGSSNHYLRIATPSLTAGSHPERLLGGIDELVEPPVQDSESMGANPVAGVMSPNDNAWLDWRRVRAPCARRGHLLRDAAATVGGTQSPQKANSWTLSTFTHMEWP